MSRCRTVCLAAALLILTGCRSTPNLATGAVTPEAVKIPAAAPLASHGWEIIPRSWSSLLKSPDGQEHPFDAGYPAGWLPDGRLLVIRWPNQKYSEGLWRM